MNAEPWLLSEETIKWTHNYITRTVCCCWCSGPNCWHGVCVCVWRSFKPIFFVGIHPRIIDGLRPVFYRLSQQSIYENIFSFYYFRIQNKLSNVLSFSCLLPVIITLVYCAFCCCFYTDLGIWPRNNRLVAVLSIGCDHRHVFRYSVDDLSILLLNDRTMYGRKTFLPTQRIKPKKRRQLWIEFWIINVFCILNSNVLLRVQWSWSPFTIITSICLKPFERNTTGWKDMSRFFLSHFKISERNKLPIVTHATNGCIASLTLKSRKSFDSGNDQKAIMIQTASFKRSGWGKLQIKGMPQNKMVFFQMCPIIFHQKPIWTNRKSSKIEANKKWVEILSGEWCKRVALHSVGSDPVAKCGRQAYNAAYVIQIYPHGWDCARNLQLTVYVSMPIESSAAFGARCIHATMYAWYGVLYALCTILPYVIHPLALSIRISPTAVTLNRWLAEPVCGVRGSSSSSMRHRSSQGIWTLWESFRSIYMRTFWFGVSV